MTDKTAQTNYSEELWMKACESALEVDVVERIDDGINTDVPLSPNRFIKCLWGLYPKEMQLATSVKVYFSSKKALERSDEFDKKEYLYLRPLFITIDNCFTKVPSRKSFILPTEDVRQFHDKGLRITMSFKRKLITSSLINILQISNNEAVFTDKYGTGIQYHESQIIQKDKAQPKLIETLIELDKQDTDQFDP